MSNDVRVRFAPSPTGYLHVGGARTALFNYLFARHTGGSFILRIEDTDLARSTEASMRDILDGLQWLGVEWDEGPQRGGGYGPYFQTERIDLYARYADVLEAQGDAYRCYCTLEELDAERARAVEEKREYKYSGRCRSLTAEERAKRQSAGTPSVLRFAIREGQTIVNDIIRGDVRFDNSLLDDFVIMKSDGMATYNFAVVIDDALMKITHVIRGEDHLSNTPRQILLYQALGFELPQFAHIPLIMGPDHTRLSKRHGATALTGYRDQGVLPQAMVNFLALLGWGHGDQQLFDMDQLVRLFELERVNKNPAVFDLAKLEWMNGQYIRGLDHDALYEASLPYLLQAGLLSAKSDDRSITIARSALPLVQERLRYLSEIPELITFFFKAPQNYDPVAADKWFVRPEVTARMRRTADVLCGLPSFDEAAVEQAIRSLAAAEGVKAGELIHPLRLALTGRSVSPGLFEIMAVIGRDECLSRIEKAIEYAS